MQLDQHSRQETGLPGGISLMACSLHRYQGELSEQLRITITDEIQRQQRSTSPDCEESQGQEHQHSDHEHGVSKQKTNGQKPFQAIPKLVSELPIFQQSHHYEIDFVIPIDGI